MTKTIKLPIFLLIRLISVLCNIWACSYVADLKSQLSSRQEEFYKKINLCSGFFFDRVADWSPITLLVCGQLFLKSKIILESLLVKFQNFTINKELFY